MISSLCLKFLLSFFCALLSVGIQTPSSPPKSMACSDHHELQAINLMVDALNSSERRTIFYLCEVSGTDTSVTYLKEILKRKVMLYESGHLLRELVLHLRRFDILRIVCKTSREEVERSLKNRQILSRFRYVVFHKVKLIINIETF